MSTSLRNKRVAAWTTAGVLGAVAVGAAALSQIGIAAAETATPSPSAGAAAPGPPGDRGMHGPHGADHAAERAALAGLLGVTETELQTQLQAGKSIAAIAKTNGVALQKVIDAIVAQEKTELTAAVKAGRLTQSQADQLSKDLVARVSEQVNRVGGPGAHGPSDRPRDGWGRGPGGGWGDGGTGGGRGRGGPGAPGTPAPSDSTTSPPTSSTTA